MCVCVIVCVCVFDKQRTRYYGISDKEALKAFELVSQLEGIIPALETSHVLAYLGKLCPELKNGERIVVNCSGRGDKDVQSAAKHFDF